MKSDERIKQAPLWNALCRQAGRVSFHMPAHRQGRSFSREVREMLTRCDTTELERTGDLAAPTEHVRQAYELAAKYFGAGETWFISTGTTTAIRVMLASSLREGDAFIVPRAVHMAAVHAIAVLGLNPRFIVPVDGKPFVDGQPDVESYLAAMRACPEAKACYVTCPDYYGRTIDLSVLAKEAHRLGMLLLVDEAHGAHFVAAPDILPPSALSQGADIVAQSAHKTLPALTPASLLHISEESIRAQRVDPHRVEKMVRVFQTSSPSFLVGASIDVARALLEQEGKESFRRIIRLNQQLADALPSSYARICLPRSDKARLVLDYSNLGLNRVAFMRELDRAGIDAELVDCRRAVFIPSIDQPEEDYNALRELLSSIQPVRDQEYIARHRREIEKLETVRDELLSAEASFEISPRQALFGNISAQKLDKAEEKSRHSCDIATTILAPYPPGMPIVWPGEVIRESHKHYIESLEATEIVVRG